MIKSARARVCVCVCVCVCVDWSKININALSETQSPAHALIRQGLTPHDYGKRYLLSLAVRPACDTCEGS